MISILKKLLAQWRDYQKTPLTYDYVEVVLQGLRYKLKKPDIRAELNSHIDDSIDYYKSKGFSDDDAYSLTKEAMGNPQDVINSFNELYNWEYRIHTVASLIALASVLFLILGIVRPMISDYHTFRPKTGVNIGMQLKAKEEVKLNNKIRFGSLQLDFDAAYLTEDNSLVLHFESINSNPFMRTRPMVKLTDTCDGHLCYISNKIPVDSNAFYVLLDNLLYVEDVQEIPNSITFTLENISGKNETFTLDLGGNTNE